MTLSRRSLITGLVSLIASPAIVRASSIMPVRPWRAPVIEELPLVTHDEIMRRMFMQTDYMRRMAEIFEREYPTALYGLARNEGGAS